MTRNFRRRVALATAASVFTGLVATTALATGASATTLTSLITNSFTGNSTPAGQWVLPGSGNGACLTAGPLDSASSVPNCSATTDSSGSGALRLTTNSNSQVGAVFNTTSLPFSQGLDIKFDTYQFDPTSATGADGISFALSVTNPADPAPPATPGPLGGSLGYSATNSTASGLPYGYLGFGFDVFGNFLNTTFGGTGCGDYGDFGDATYPEDVTVRGPGEGTSGYCVVATTGNSSSPSTGTDANNLQDGGATLDDPSDTTHNSSDEVPVEIAINPSSTATTTPSSGLTVPADGFLVVFTPVGGAQKTITGTLPDLNDFSSLGFPSSWFNPSTGYPYQVTFGWTASTGGDNEYHEINTLDSETLNGPLPTLSLSDTDSSSGVLAQGGTGTFTLTPSVASADEASAPTVTDTFPAGVVPDLSSSSFGGTSWDCSASSGQTVSCTWTGGTVDEGSSYNPITVPVNVASGASLGAANDSAKISSEDALAATAQDDFTVEGLPSAPTNVTGSARDGAADLSWDTPASNGDSAITGYVVTPYVDGVAQAAQTLTSTATTGTVTALTPGTAYSFAVAAVNGIGTGPASTVSGPVTPNAGPTITTTTLPGDDVGTTYAQGISSTGGTGPYDWSVSAGSRPASASTRARVRSRAPRPPPGPTPSPSGSPTTGAAARASSTRWTSPPSPRSHRRACLTARRMSPTARN